MISLYTPVPQIATKSSDTERKNNRKSVRVIIYTVVKINSRPIGIGEREKWAVACTHRRRNAPPCKLTHTKNQNADLSTTTGHIELPDYGSVTNNNHSFLKSRWTDSHSLYFPVCRRPILRIHLQKESSQELRQYREWRIVAAPKKLLQLSQQRHETQTSIISNHIITLLLMVRSH